MIPSRDASNQSEGHTPSDTAAIPSSLETDSGSIVSSTLHPGDFLADRYLIESLVARGGMGEVYRARDTELCVSVALKTIRFGVTSDLQALRRFKQEILLARSISHPNVCRMFDLGRHRDETRDVLFLTMEFLPGETLSSRIRSRGRIPCEEGLPIVRQVAEALDTAHRAGIVHRDFKSSNVMIVPSTSGERVVITDFGLAMAARIPGMAEDESMEQANMSSAAESGMLVSGSFGPTHSASDSKEATVAFGRAWSIMPLAESYTRSFVGTPAYMAPEQVRGDRVGPAADLYSLGVVLFEMATGMVPFHGLTPMETARARLMQDPPRPSSLATVEQTWEEAILRLLAREPEQRFSHARDVVEAIEGNQSAAVVARHFLPAERDAFVGRDRELDKLASCLEGGGALLTILGAGGTGKTRLARRYGWNSLERWPGGIWFCDLTEARSVDGIAHAVASSLDVSLGKGDPIAQLGHAIAGRGRALIILDNFEQVSEHAEGTLGRWVARARETSFLVTSRQRLQLAGETSLDLDPLDVETEGVELFAQRAKEHRSDFALNDVNRAIVAEIVRLVDGLPLAIELAAARLRTLSLEQLWTRLGDRLSLLTGPKRGRHRTLRATLDWSWELLQLWEQAAVAQASVFEGGFTLEAAEDVLDLALWADAPPVLDVVQALVDKCWFRARVVVGGPRFAMLSSMQEYAAEKLNIEDAVAAPGGWNAVSRFEQRHGESFARWGTHEAVVGLDRFGGVLRRQMLQVELGNLVSAVFRAVKRGDGKVAVPAMAAAGAVFDLRGPFDTAIELGRATAAIPGLDSEDRACALRCLAQAMQNAGQLDDALGHCEEALTIFQASGNRAEEGTVLGELGHLLMIQGRQEDACRHLERALALHRENGNRHGEAVVLHSLCFLNKTKGRMEDGCRRYEEALAIHREVGDRCGEGEVLGSLGVALKDLGRMDDARRHYEEALAVHREVGNRNYEGRVLGSLGILYAIQGRTDEARHHYEAALAIHRQTGNRRLEGYFIGNLGILDMDQDRVKEAWCKLETALSIHREVGDRRGECGILENLGILAMKRGRSEDAFRCLEEALAISRKVGDRQREGYSLACLGDLEMRRDQMELARSRFDEALAIHREVGDRRGEGIVLCHLGKLHVSCERIDDARRIYEEALVVHREVGNRPGEGDVFTGLGDLELDQHRTREARHHFEKALSISREVGQPVREAYILGRVGELEFRERRFTEGRQAFVESEALLHSVDETLELAKLICSRGESERLAGDLPAARTALAEAESIAEAVGAGPKSELGRKLVALREHLAGSDESVPNLD